MSTVWLGLNHGPEVPGALPVIFETMVFAPDGHNLGPELDGRRYTTETDAIAGHHEYVTLLNATTRHEPEPGTTSHDQPS